jgi:hypothetical protein
MEPLRQFLMDSLKPTPIELEDSEVITDALVVFRVSSIDETNDGISERYRYTVTKGVNLAMAYGMLHLTQATLDNYYFAWLDEDEDED